MMIKQMILVLVAIVFCLMLSEAFGGTRQSTCTTTSSVLVPASNSRKFLHLRNQNATSVNVFICYGETCTVSNGVFLLQNTFLEDSYYRGSVTCITASSTVTMGIIED